MDQQIVYHFLDTLAYVEFGVLLVLSVAIVVVGLLNLKDEAPLKK